MKLLLGCYSVPSDTVPTCPRAQGARSPSSRDGLSNRSVPPRLKRFTLAGIEATQFQELFKDWVFKESAKSGLSLPVEGIHPNTDKILRISKMQPQIKNRIIRFRRNPTQLVDQVKYFPKADHDDGPDALEKVFSLITHHTTYGLRIRTLSV